MVWCGAGKPSGICAWRGCAMTRILSSVIAALLLVAGLLWWQVDRQAVVITKVTGQRDTAVAQAGSLRNTLRLQRELAADAAEIDQRHIQPLSQARGQNDRLAAHVAAGNRRLHVAAHCPPAGVSDASSPAGMDDGAAAELTPIARQDYFTLRSQLKRT